VREARRRLLQALLVPSRVTVGAEEDRAHVVVDTDDVGAQLVEISHGLGPDEAIGSSHENSHRLTLTPASGPDKKRVERRFFFHVRARPRVAARGRKVV
jgi:hypothetical protein